MGGPPKKTCVSVEPAEYKHIVLSLFFLKFASDKFEAQRKAISEKYGEKFVDNVAFYTKDNVFFLPEISRWSFIMENAKQDDIALKIDTALYTIEKANPALKGALPDNYYSRLHIDTAKLASLLDEIDKINTGDKENDIIGRVYEYFLSKFALAEGKSKGEFYTPKCIVNLIAEMIEPYDGILCQKSNAANHDQQHNRDIDYRAVRVAGKRWIAVAFCPKNVKPGVAKSRYGMKYRHPDAAPSIVTAEHRQHGKRPPAVQSETSLAG